MDHMDALRIVCGFVGTAIGIIGGNVVWLRHCNRTNKTNMAWFDGPLGHWQELNRRERRQLLAFATVFLVSFAVFFVWLKG
jgi:hypothetical protein